MRKILIKYNETLYKFINFIFKDDVDGSLYLVFDRNSKSSEKISYRINSPSASRVIVNSSEKLKISYHATGRVNFDGVRAPTIYCEPIYNITKYQSLFWVWLPSVSSLTVVDVDKDDPIIEIPNDHLGPIAFHIAMIPLGLVPPNGTIAMINYERWFSIGIQFAEFPFQIPEDLTNHVTKVCCPVGQYPRQLVNKDIALISVHKKRTNSSDSLISYWTPENGMYKIVFNTPMRIPPNAKIKFEDPSIEADIVKTTCSEVRFRARGKGGYINSAPQTIIALELDAEL